MPDDKSTDSARASNKKQQETINNLNEFGRLIISDKNHQSIPKDVMFPDELNCYLREQIQYYAHEHAMVKRNLSDLEEQYQNATKKISELENKLNNYEAVLNKSPYVTSNQVAAEKIVELTKKIREKTSEVESLKTKCSRLEKSLFEYKNIQSETSVEQKQPSTESTSNVSEDEIKKLTDKLNHVNNKLVETRNLNLQLKNDLKMAKKWLQQEIGESFETLQALTSNNSWRGRGQIICDLQQKNNELKEKLKSSQERLNVCFQETSSIKADSKISLLSKENDDLKYKFEDLKKKYDSMKARCRVLDTDFGLFKSRYNMMKEQAEKDQKVIETLAAQLSNPELKAEKTQKEKLLKKLQTEKNQMIQEIDEFKNVIKGLKEDIESKNKEIERVKADKTNGIEKELTNKIPNLQPREIEKLLEHIEKLNERLSAERDAHVKTQVFLKIEKQKAAKAEALAARVELDSNKLGKYSSTLSLKSCESSLSDQLELAQENLKALETRLGIEQYERKADLQEFAEVLRSYEKNITEI